MNEDATIRVEIVYATPERVWHRQLELARGTDILHAIIESGLDRAGAVDLTQCRVGVYGKLCALEDLVQNGDRIEIYRALVADPMDARRRRIRKRTAGK